MFTRRMVDEAFNFCLGRKKSNTRVPQVIRDATFPQPFIVKERNENTRAAVVAAYMDGLTYAEVHAKLKEEWHLQQSPSIVGRYITYYQEALTFYWLMSDFEQFYAPIANKPLDKLISNNSSVYVRRFADVGIYTIGDFLQGCVTQSVTTTRRTATDGLKGTDYYAWTELIRQELYILADNAK